MDFYKGFDKNIKKDGFWKACDLLVKNLGLRPSINLKNFPKKGAVLVYSNHPTGLDPFLLASVFKRNDFLFLGDMYHTLKGKNTAKFVAPSVESNFIAGFIKRRPTNWPGYISMRLKSPPVRSIIAKDINSKAIDRIIKNLKNGGLSLVFPSGGEYEFLPWKNGIKKIISTASRQKIKFILYKISIKNFSEFKLILHFLTFKKYFGNLLIEGVKTSTIIK